MPYFDQNFMIFIGFLVIFSSSESTGTCSVLAFKDMFNFGMSEKGSHYAIILFSVWPADNFLSDSQPAKVTGRNTQTSIIAIITERKFAKQNHKVGKDLVFIFNCNCKIPIIIILISYCILVGPIPQKQDRVKTFGTNYTSRKGFAFLYFFVLFCITVMITV